MVEITMYHSEISVATDAEVTKKIPQNHENTATFLAQSISNRYYHIVKGNERSACRW